MINDLGAARFYGLKRDMPQLDDGILDLLRNIGRVLIFEIIFFSNRFSTSKKNKDPLMTTHTRFNCVLLYLIKQNYKIPRVTDSVAPHFGKKNKKDLTEVGFEPTPPKRLEP